MATKNNTTDSTVKTRTGSIVTLIALLLPLIIALVAFSVDYGIIVVAKHELQNAADAAATATLETLNIDQKSADLAAFETITANHLLGTQLDFNMDLDIHYGTWDDEAREFTVIERTSTPSSPTDVSGSSIPNGATAVRVRLTRSRARSNGVRLFFAPVIGTNFAEVEAEAIAAGTPGCNGFYGIDFVNVRNQAKTDSYNSEIGEKMVIRAATARLTYAREQKSTAMPRAAVSPLPRAPQFQVGAHQLAQTEPSILSILTKPTSTTMKAFQNLHSILIHLSS